jgi:hypothetical protein
LKIRKQKLFFFPDKLLVVSGRKVGAVNYSDITMGFGISKLEVNKNGTPGEAP